MAEVVIRQAVDADLDGIRRVVGDAFGAEDAEHGRTVVELVELLHTSGHARAELVAVEDDTVIGHVLLSHSWIDSRERLVGVLVLSPLCVAPDRQGRGTGTQLVAAALDAGRELGTPAVFLEGSPDYYGSRGFAPATAYGFGRPSVRVPEPAFQVAVLDAHESWMSGALVYCEPFWTLDCVGLRGPRLERIEQVLEN